ncbi:DNA polymerase III subunit beta [Membranihabitans marinus]|uniref:DNA polymerase III subunit beta n=1 Tax=Membranihabitans marinus TaxID=1227546 RepID=UPI001F022FBE|nr:DNA polymerase III subunit beta [Membranihabitans marinus]
MKFSVSSSDLLKKIQVATGVLPTNAIMPILDDFLMELKGDQLTLIASDLETTLRTVITVNGVEDGTMAVRGKILNDTIKALPEQPIEFAKEENESILVIKTSNGEYKLASDNFEEFPQIPDAVTSEGVEIPVPILESAISRTLFATSNDEMRQAMMGVYLHIQKDKLIFVATDAHKLVKYTYLDFNTSQEGSMIIPKKSLNLVRQALKGSGNVKLNYSNSHVFMEMEDTEIGCRLIDAQFPNYNAVIPTENPNLLTIDRVSFIQSLKRISIYANKTTNQLVLTLDNDGILIKAQDLDYHNEAEEKLSCQYSGDPMEVAFNSKFLVEMLTVLDTDDVIMEFSTPNRASLILPSSSADDEDLLMLVMPVMVNR